MTDAPHGSNNIDDGIETANLMKVNILRRFLMNLGLNG